MTKPPQRDKIRKVIQEGWVLGWSGSRPMVDEVKKPEIFSPYNLLLQFLIPSFNFKFSVLSKSLLEGLLKGVAGPHMQFLISLVGRGPNN